MEVITLPKKHGANVKVTCPECKEASEGKLRFRAENKNSFDAYHCSLCQNEWDPSEVITEEYKIARFRGRDGEWKFVSHSESNTRKMRENTNMWNPRALKRDRNSVGRWSKRDANLLKRLRK
tara:strand:+ start:453 stop:818 length:366 start_codon:yes stop_codon:yes gene_type:complete